MVTNKLVALYLKNSDDLIDNDGKVDCFKRHTQIKTRVQNPDPLYDLSKWQKIDALYMTKRLKTISFGAARALYSSFKGEPLKQGSPRGCCLNAPVV